MGCAVSNAWLCASVWQGAKWLCGLQWRGLPYGECTWEKYDDILKAGGPENVQQLKVSDPVLSCPGCLAGVDNAMMLCAALGRSSNLCLSCRPCGCLCTTHHP